MIFGRRVARITRALWQQRHGRFGEFSRFLCDDRGLGAGPGKCLICSPSEAVLGCREFSSWGLRSLSVIARQIHHQSSSLVEEHLDPFSLVADDLSLVCRRLHDMVIAEVPKLASAAEYFFELGVEGKRFCPIVLLLMATALNVPVPESSHHSLGDNLSTELRMRQQAVVEIAEMIHVASLIHDDVFDDADTRRKIGSLNFIMGNKISVLAGDFLLSRAYVALAALKNTEVVSLISIVVEHLVTVETMQMTTSSEKCCSMEYYMQKTFYKTASLISNSWNCNCSEVVSKCLDDPVNIELALKYLGKSRGIQRAMDLAKRHADLVAEAIDALPKRDNEDVRRSRRALIDLTRIVITRTK